MAELTVPQLSDEAVSQYLDEAIERFNQAAARTISVQRFFHIAGQSIEIQIAGERLIQLLTPALMHRAIPRPSSSPHLTIRAFDTATTGVPMPRPIWPNFAYATRSGLLPGISNQQILAAYNFNTGIFNMLDSVRGQGIYWIGDSQQHPTYEISTPFRIQLAWWMRMQARYLVHAGAVAKGNGGLLFVGKSGSGKSTAALACLAAGWEYLADDFVLFGLDPQPTAYNIYQSAKVTGEHFGNHFAHLTHAVYQDASPVYEKTLLLLNEHFSGRIAAHCPLRAVIFPQVTDARTPSLKAVARQSTFIALAATTLKYLPGATPQHAKAMMALVEQTPNYSLEIGGDPDQIPVVLEQLLQ